MAEEEDQDKDKELGLDLDALDVDDCGASEVTARIVAAKSLREKLRAKGFPSPQRKAAGKGGRAASPKSNKKSTSSAKSSTAGVNVKTKKTLLKKAKGSVKGGKGKRYCKACGLYFDLDCFDINDPYCPIDRPGMKRLQRLANAQGKQALFKEVKGDSLRLQKMVARYHEVVGDEASTDRQKQRLPLWSWAQYSEYETSEQQTRRRCRGVMMHEERL